MCAAGNVPCVVPSTGMLACCATHTAAGTNANTVTSGTRDDAARVRARLEAEHWHDRAAVIRPRDGNQGAA